MAYENNDWLIKIVENKFLETVQKEKPRQHFTQEDIENIVGETIDEKTDEAGYVIYEYMLNDVDELESFHEITSNFENNLKEHWEEPLNFLDRLIFWSYQIGQSINFENRPEAVQKQDLVFEALIYLHARGVQVAREIHKLLKSGFADGALARWRLLYELSITSTLIKKYGQNTARQFFHFQIIEEYNFLKVYQEYTDRLDLEEIEAETVESLKGKKNELVDRYGSDFNDVYGNGWLKSVYDGNGNLTLRKMAKLANLDHYYPYYKLACTTIHGGVKGTLDRVGSIKFHDLEQPNQIQAGPSNAGLEIAGQLTAISLSQITFKLINLNPSFIYIAQMKGIQHLVDDLKQSFAEKAKELVQDERRVIEEWASQDIIDIALNYIGAKELLTSEFFEKHTDFKSISDFEETISILIKDINDRENFSNEINDAARKCTDSETMKELIELTIRCRYDWI